MNQGFTLIELLVVVLIVGILSAVALPQYQTAVERSRATEALTLMTAIRESMERYHSQREAWPSNFDQLDVDIPTYQESGATLYGGKNFHVTFSSDGSTATITAARRRTQHTYTLTTTVTENPNGTYSFTRSCTPADDDEASAYCNAISGGKQDDF